MELLKGITHLNHACIRITRDKVIYIDPFKITGTPHDADIIFCTHDHMDHLSPNDIKNIMKTETILVVPQKKVRKFKKYLKKAELHDVVGVEPLNEYEAYGIKFKTVPAYNLEKRFHKRRKNWVGYILDLDDTSYYFAGDTDYIPEMAQIKADVIFLPVGGTYTMNAQEAARAANCIKPKIAIPIHFGSIVGTQKDAKTFIENLAEGIESKILLNN
ncbi:MAG: MBL fold metallo-hydrolase [Acidobacteria bacterium]|jgi:L-ascorbate metabolism protein UlaG (beta-lactamase superfamily)|nr:MBL fold metallo-hydrolase [Acidobacteriota bacterium]